MSNDLVALLLRCRAEKQRVALARQPHLAPELLIALSDDREWTVRQAVAEHPLTSNAILLKLALDSDRDVRVAVAENPNCTPLMLECLALDPDISDVALGNHSLPDYLCDLSRSITPKQITALVQRYSKAESTDIERLLQQCPAAHALLAAHPYTPTHYLEFWALDIFNWRTRQKVALNPNTPAHSLLLLASDEDCDVRGATVAHPQLPKAALECLLFDRSPVVRQSLASLNWPDAIANAIRAEEYQSLHNLLSGVLTSAELSQWAIADYSLLAALHPLTPSVRLAQLWQKHPQEVANNPNTPSEILSILATHSDDDVRTAVAFNPNSSTIALECLLLDSEQKIRETVLANPQAASWMQRTPRYVPRAISYVQQHSDSDLATLQQWLFSSASELRQLALRHPCTPLASMLLLVFSEEPLEYLAMRQDMSTEALTLLSTNSSWRVRQAVAEHSLTPPEVLAQLAADEDSDVQMAVANNPNTPSSAIEAEDLLSNKRRRRRR